MSPEPRLELEVQYASAAGDLPSQADFRRWAAAALDPAGEPAELVIRIVDEEESRDFNRRYRGIDRPTNVLSFPFEAPPEVESRHLGDLLLCAPVIRAQAREQHKAGRDHWAHMVVHGVLHLRGYDHLEEAQAQQMEDEERRILATLGIADPYRTEDVA